MTEREAFLARYKQGLGELELRENDVVLFINSVKELECGDCVPFDYIDGLLDHAGPGVTVVMQTFNWDFCQGKPYSHRTSFSQTGLISEVFRRMDGVVRSPHPIYSFCALGPRAEEMCLHPGPTCWGRGTPLEQLLDADALCVNLGKPFPWGISLLHYFEEEYQVPYRFYKTFEGVADFGEGKRDYRTDFYVRDLVKNLEYRWQPAVDLLIERGLIGRFGDAFPLTAVRASDLAAACRECLDRDVRIFLGKGHPSFRQ